MAVVNNAGLPFWHDLDRSKDDFDKQPIRSLQNIVADKRSVANQKLNENSDQSNLHWIKLTNHQCHYVTFYTVYITEIQTIQNTFLLKSGWKVRKLYKRERKKRGFDK